MIRRLLVVCCAFVAVFALLGLESASTAEAQGKPVLRRGSRGAAVQELQRRLNVWIAANPRSGLRQLPVNGVFEVRTEAAVKALQKAKGLRQTGVVDARTWAVLPAAPAAAPATVRYDIRNLVFNPATITIRAGTTVVWTNRDAVPHTVTHGRGTPGGMFDSGIFNAGQSFRYTFRTAGTYAYYCIVHPDMVGTVRVTAR